MQDVRKQPLMKIDDFVKTVVLGVRLQEDTKRVCSWAYHRTECLAMQEGYGPAEVQAISCTRARRTSVPEFYPMQPIALPRNAQLVPHLSA